jgi:hypothetical protein
VSFCPRTGFLTIQILYLGRPSLIEIRMTVQNRHRRSQVGFLVQADWKLAVDCIVYLILFLKQR